MRFVKNYTPPDFQAKHFTPLISLHFNSFSDKNTKKWVFLEKFTPLTKIFTLPAAMTAVTNLTSVCCIRICGSMHVWCICFRNITDPPVSYLDHLLLIIHHDTRSSNQLCKCKIPGTSFWLLALSRNNKVNTQNHPLHFRIHTIDLICVIWCDKWWQLFLMLFLDF